jgi:hypothetical protein
MRERTLGSRVVPSRGECAARRSRADSRARERPRRRPRRAPETPREAPTSGAAACAVGSRSVSCGGSPCALNRRRSRFKRKWGAGVERWGASIGLERLFRREGHGEGGERDFNAGGALARPPQRFLLSTRGWAERCKRESLTRLRVGCRKGDVVPGGWPSWAVP